MNSLARSIAVALTLAAVFAPLTVQAHKCAVTDMASAANLFITTLDDNQKKEAVFEWKYDKMEGWHFVPDRIDNGKKMRHGLPIKKMTPRQRILAHALLSSGMSNKGYLQASIVMMLE